MRAACFVTLVLTSTLGLACDPSPPPGLSASSSSGVATQAIVNGTRDPQTVLLSDEEQRAVGWLFPIGAASTPFCTGTIVAPDLVVTAAHCVNGTSFDEVGFGVGLVPTSPEATFSLSAIYVNRQTDAAMLVLAQDATQAGIDITPIPINSETRDSSHIGRAVQAGGYGETYDPSRTGRWFATVYIYDVQNNLIVVDGRGQEGICFGDSGSGLIDLDSQGNPVVLAVESGGDSTCVDIDRMARLDTIADWIDPILAGEVPEDPCAGIGFEGACQGEVAVSCRRGYRQTDCASMATTCELGDNGRYGCSCDGIPDEGYCDGDNLEFCRFGGVSQFSCSFVGGTCGWDPGEAAYNCLEDAICRAEDASGRCEGDMLVECANGRTTRRLCSAEGGSCIAVGEGAVCDIPDVPDDGGGDSDAGVFGDVQPDVGGDGAAATSSEGCAIAGSGTPDPSVLLAVVTLLGLVRRRRTAG